MLKTSIHQKIPLKDDESNLQSKRRYSLYICLVRNLYLVRALPPRSMPAHFPPLSFPHGHASPKLQGTPETCHQGSNGQRWLILG